MKARVLVGLTLAILTPLILTGYSSGDSTGTQEGRSLDSYVGLRYSKGMCGRRGCISRRAHASHDVKAAVIEGSLEPAVLLLLQEADGYGYELAGALQERGFVGGRVLPARVYETLRRLEQANAMRAYDEGSPDGPARRRYRITASGRQHLASWVKALRLTERQMQLMIQAYEASTEPPPI